MLPGDTSSLYWCSFCLRDMFVPGEGYTYGNFGSSGGSC